MKDKIKLPDSELISITFSKPANLTQLQYMQDFIFYTEGAVSPYIYDNPEKALIPSK